MKIPNKIRYLNKKFLNRLTLRIAGKMHCPIALIRHSGRKTGRLYVTPILVARVEDGFVFALTYGNHMDWYRNIMAAGGGELVWQEREYLLSAPCGMDAVEGRACFPQPLRTMLKGWDTKDFFRMTSSLE